MTPMTRMKDPTQEQVYSRSIYIGTHNERFETRVANLSVFLDLEMEKCTTNEVVRYHGARNGSTLLTMVSTFYAFRHCLATRDGQLECGRRALLLFVGVFIVEEVDPICRVLTGG